LVQDVRSIDGQWVAYSGHGTRTPQHILSASTARSILAAMRTSDRIAGHGGAAFSGDKQLSWFIGLAPNDRPQYAIAVLIETPLGNAATEAEAMGRAVLKTLMQP
jgi:cell division protein FtsI/penicillin-binding protein 2